MTDTELQTFLAEYPEAPNWIIERGISLEEARAMMELRRRAFPKTAPAQGGPR